MASTISQKNAMKYVHTIIMLLFMFGFRYITPPEYITEVGMQVIGVFIGVLWGWITIGIGWPSCVGIVALGLTDIMSPTELLVNAFGSQVFVLMIALLMLTAFIEETGLGDIIVSWLLSRKIIEGKPFFIFFTFLMASWAASVVSNCNASCIMMCELYRVLMNKTGLKAKSIASSAFVVGISITTVLGDCTLPFKNGAILYSGAYTAASGVSFNMMSYTIMGVLMTVMFVAVYSLFCKYILRIDLSALKDAGSINMQRAISKREKISLICVGVVMISLLLPGLLPQEWNFTILLNKMGLGHISLLLIAVMCIINIDGEQLMDFSRVTGKYKWDVLFLMAMLMPLASSLVNDATGVKLFVSEHLSVLASGLSPAVYIFFMIAAAALVTNFANNVIVGTIFVSLAVVLAPVMTSVNSEALSICIILAVNASVFFPAASPVNAICFSQTDLISFKNQTIVGLIVMAFYTIIVSLIAYPLAAMMF